MRVLVTGGAGFIGSNLVRRLTETDTEVVVLDDFSTGLRANLTHLPVEVRQGSLALSADVRDAADGCTHVVHLGARGSVPRSIQNPVATHSVNATGTLNVLEACRDVGAYLIFSSSSSVYGSSRAIPKTEDLLTAPMTPYAASKLSAEAYVQAYAHSFGVSSIVFRFFNVYGPWQRPNHDYAAVIPKWIWNAMRQQTVVVNGDGSISRDFTYVDDVVEVLARAISEKVTHPTPVNLAFGNSITLRNVLEQLRNHFGDVTTVFGSPRAGDVQHSQNNPRLLLELFPGLQPRSFEEGFTSTVEWLAKSADALSMESLDHHY